MSKPVTVESIYFKVTNYGFKYGGAEITRIALDNKEGWVVLSIKSKKQEIQVYVTKTGKMRFFNSNGIDELSLIKKLENL